MAFQCQPYARRADRTPDESARRVANGTPSGHWKSGPNQAAIHPQAGCWHDHGLDRHTDSLLRPDLSVCPTQQTSLPAMPTTPAAAGTASEAPQPGLTGHHRHPSSAPPNCWAVPRHTHQAKPGQAVPVAAAAADATATMAATQAMAVAPWRPGPSGPGQRPARARTAPAPQHPCWQTG